MPLHVGRPAYQPTPKDRGMVKAMAGYGIPDYDIAKVVGVSLPTLRKYYAQELEVGHIHANAKVAEALYQKAIGPGKEGVSAAIFWLKCRAGWREKDNEQQPGKKELADIRARTAEQGSDWETLLN